MINNYLTLVEKIQQQALKKKQAELFIIDIQLTNKITGDVVEASGEIYANNADEAEKLRQKIIYRIYENSENRLQNETFGLMFPRTSGYKKRHAFLLMFWKDPVWKHSISKGLAPQGIKPFSLLTSTAKQLFKKSRNDTKEVNKKSRLPKKQILKNILIHTSMYFIALTAMSCYVLYKLQQDPINIIAIASASTMSLLVIIKIISCMKDYMALQNEVNTNNE